MTNTSMLKEKIKESGYKLEYLARKVGITRQCFSDKVNGNSSFNQYQIKILCDLLDITDLSEKENIFFAN